jgi:hypothetical protein
MGRVEAAAAMDRLPWLPDEPRRSARDSNAPAGWAAAAFVLVAGTGFWLGARTSQEPRAPHAASTTTVRLPPARQASAPAIIQGPDVMPQHASADGPERPPVRRPSKSARPVKAEPTARSIRPVSPRRRATPARPALRKPIVRSPAGALVEVGAFGSAGQATRGWRAVVRADPRLAHLQAVVIRSRNSKGRPFYRVQIRTALQAHSRDHSRDSCANLRKIGLSCAVVAQPAITKR